MIRRFPQMLKFLLSRKKVLLAGAFLVLFLAFFPSLAGAGLGDALDHVNPLSGIGGTIFNAILSSIAGVLDIMFQIIADLLRYVYIGLAKAMVEISKWILGFGVRPGAEHTPSFVTTTWNGVRQLTNVFFILILTFIGLATILRLPSYQMKQLLPWLVVMALLINFSGVFVGFIVDMSNLVTIWLLDQAATAGWDNFEGVGDVPSFLGGDSDELTQKLFTHIAAIIYYVVAILIYFVIMILFVVRAMFLWALVILAPLAFASYILPATRARVWGEWWRTLIQWSIFVIPLALFMWIASHALNFSFTEISDPGGEEAAFLANILAPFTALLLLYLGVTTSQQMAPAAAKAVGGFAAGKAALGAASAAWRFRGMTKPLTFKGKTIIPKIGLEKGLGESIQGAGAWLARKGTTVSQKEHNAQEAKMDKQIKEKNDQRIKVYRDFKDGKISRPELTKKNTELKKDIAKLEEQKKNLPGVHRQGAGKVLGAAPAFLARWAGRGIEYGAADLDIRKNAKDNREIREGEAEGSNRASADNIAQINQEFLKGPLANLNRVVGLLKVTIEKNNDADDVQTALRDRVLDGEKIGKAILAAQRGGPPAYRPLFKTLQKPLLENPEMFGKEFQRDGTRMTKYNTPEFHNKWVERGVEEVIEKATKSDITSKIFGDAIDFGKAGGQEFSKVLIENLIRFRGGDLASELMRRPETIEGREMMARIINDFVQNNHRDIDDTTLRSLGKALTSPGAATAGTTLTLKYPVGYMKNGINVGGNAISFTDIRDNLVEIFRSAAARRTTTTRSGRRPHGAGPGPSHTTGAWGP